MKRILFVMFAAMLASGCSTMVPIKYSLDDVTQEDKSISNIKVKILPVVDARKNSDKNGVLFSSDSNTHTYNGKLSCLNSEKHYETEKVSSQITSLVIEHLSKKYPEIEVVETSETTPDFEISSEIGNFFAVQDTSAAAMVGAQFGLIGALLTMNETSNGEVSISFENVVIRDGLGNMVSDIGTVDQNWDGDFNVDAYCWSPYWHINEKLKFVVDELVSKIGQEIAWQ